MIKHMLFNGTLVKPQTLRQEFKSMEFFYLEYVYILACYEDMARKTPLGVIL